MGWIMDMIRRHALIGGVKHLMQLEVESGWQPTEQQATKEGSSFGPGHPVGQSVRPG